MSTEHKTCDCGCMGVGPAVTRLMDSFGPADARDHFRAARVEFLKGMRALIDARIDHLTRAKESEGQSVPVE